MKPCFLFPPRCAFKDRARSQWPIGRAGSLPRFGRGDNSSVAPRERPQRANLRRRSERYVVWRPIAIGQTALTALYFSAKLYPMSEQQRRALVTGGGSGIGLAIALTLADCGHPVVVAGQNELKLKQTGLQCVVMDVCDQESVEAGLRQCGPIDIFVANAGGVTTASALNTLRAHWERMIALNLTSVFTCAQAAVPAMIERGWGRFIVIGSTASLKGYRYASAYAASKHGVLGLVRSMALELAKTGVTANALCPGYTDTAITAEAAEQISAKTGRTHGEALRSLTSSNPMGRLVAPAEIAAAALWLASDAAAAVNGQAIAIDGGETA